MANYLNRIIIVTLLGLGLFSHVTYAQVQRLATSEGLSQSYVNTMLLDNNGYLWLATEGGLNRYDGYQVVHIKGPNGELEEAIIDRIYQDPDGYIWIASLQAGLFRYDPRTGEYQQFITKPTSEEQVFTESVFSMLAIDKETLWLGRGWDFAKLDLQTGKVTSVFEIPERDKTSVVRELYHYQGYIFLGTSNGAYVYHIASGKVRQLEHLQSKPEHIYQNYVKSFLVTEQQTLLVGAVRGLYQVDIDDLDSFFANTNKRFTSRTLIPDLNIWTIINHGDGVYLGTDKGLFNYTFNNAALVKDKRLSKSKYTLADPSIIDIVKDKSGGMWLATKNDGAFYLPFDNYNFQNVAGNSLLGDGFSHHSIWGVTEFQERLWLGTHNGLTAIDLDTMTSQVYLKNYKVDLFTTEFSVYKVMPYKELLWLHTNRGLYSFDPNQQEIKPVTTADPEQQVLINNWVHGVLLMPNGELFYVHPDYGMFVYNIDTQHITRLSGQFDGFEPFLAYGFLPPLSTQSTAPLFYNAGILYQVNPKTYELTTIYTVPEQHENVAVNVMSYVVDKNNILWLSLSNFGLIGVDATSYELIHTIDLEKNKLGTLLYDMVLDEAGMIWMSSHKGLWRLNPDNLHFQQFTSAEGLLSTEFNSGAFTRLQTGQIVYGTLKGFTYFEPRENHYQQALIDRVNITNIDLMSRDLSAEYKQPIETIVLEHDDIGLEVAFSAMAFNYQERIIYEYQLSDDQKAYTRNNNRVLFPKLSPGKYHLKVWARDPLTGDLTPPAVLSIEVKYPLWRAPHFIFLYIILLALCVTSWVVRRNRTQQLLLAAHKESKQSEARLKLALEGSHSGVWDWSSTHPMIYQPRLKSELGYTIESVHLDDYLAKIHPHDKQTFRLEWLEFLSTDKGYFNCTYRLRHCDGQWRWYKDFGKVVEWHDGAPEKVAGTYTNMTRELVFEEYARLFGAAFEQTRDWVFILDRNLRIRATNKALQAAFKFPSEPRSSRSLTLGLPRTKRISYLRIMQKLQSGEHFSAEDMVTVANGESRHVLIKISAIADSNQQLDSYVIIVTDISAQKVAENELHLLANYDPLTGLPNKALFQDRVIHALQQADYQQTKAALLNINIKRFKYFNDSFGHEAADELIKQVALRLKRAVRPQDSIARFDGNEFVILLEDMQQIEDVLVLCNKLMETVKNNFVIHEQAVNLNLSIGVAIYPDDGKDSKTLLKAANIALLHAKKNLEGSYQFYEQEMNIHVKKTLHLESQLTKAYQQHEFCNFYQPIVNAESHQIEGFEVLLRWPNNTEHEPQSFATAAESIGLITKIMLQTLSRALVELKQWRLIHPTLYISINLSALDFEYQDLVADVANALRLADIPAEALVFEITESILMRDSSSALESMLKLKELGCRIYMDDFGTGYASLTYLKRFPIDVLKIDRSFVQDIGRDSDDEAIINSTLTLAKSLGKECVAEGVENKQQLRFLMALGCKYFQGYLFSQAVSSDAVAALLNKTWSEKFND
ncbi:EAL domain-containing protein [Pseudoalteromonas mariniglutinosa]|uniref:EAL domain-containing protein n=1 Tax=Pseudoalteromonas mariniglutinosa TaxID=206042 RepID=UPI00384E5AD3